MLTNIIEHHEILLKHRYGDLKSRVLHVPGPIQRDVVTALEVRGEWIRVQQRHGDEMYWLPTKIHGLGTILECLSDDVDKNTVASSSPAPPVSVTEEDEEKKIVEEESVVLSPSVKNDDIDKNSSSDVVVEMKEEKEQETPTNNKDDSTLDMAYPDDDDDDDEMSEPPPSIPKRADALPEQW